MKKIVIVTIVLVLALCAFGCSNNTAADDTGAEAPAAETEEATPAEGADTPAEGDASDDSSAAASGDLDVVTFVLPRDIEVLDDVHLVCADKMGYFAEEGIQVEFEKSMGTSDMTMISMGQGDVCLPDSFVYLIGMDGDLPLKSIFQQDVRPLNCIAVNADNDEINTLQDLEGKTIALGDAAWSACIDPILIEAGVDPSTIEYVVAGENRAQMVAEGKADAVFTWEKLYQLWNAQGMDFKVITFEGVANIPGNPVVTSVDNIENKSDILERFLRGYAKGIYFVTCNPEAATEIVLERFPSIDVEFDAALEVVEAAAYVMNDEGTEANGYGYIDPERWELCSRLIAATGIVSQEFTADQLMTNDFVAAANEFDHDKVKSDAENYSA